KACVRVHVSISIKCRWEHRDPSFEIPIHGNPRGTCIPVIAMVVLESVAMTGAGYKTAWLVGDWVVRRVSEWAERMVASVCAIRIDVEFCPGRAVLQIIFPV